MEVEARVWTFGWLKLLSDLTGVKWQVQPRDRE